MDLKDLKLSTGGDVAAGALAAAIGAAVDAFFFPGGLPATQVAGFALTGGVGVKRAVQSIFGPRWQRRRRRREITERTESLVRFDPTDGAEHVVLCFRMWQDGALDDERMLQELAAAESRILEVGPSKQVRLALSDPRKP